MAVNMTDGSVHCVVMYMTLKISVHTVTLEVFEFFFPQFIAL